jgi:hypothetical protein
VLVVPLLLLPHGADAVASPERAPAVAAGPARVPTTTTTTRPATAPVAIASAPVRVVVPTTTTTVPPTATTTTVPPTTTTTTAPAPALSAAHVRSSGDVTYYDHPAGRCASPWLPFGTVVQITNPANGATVSCVVDDREADTARSIDLATSTFAAIAPLSQGVVVAQLSW